MRMGDIGSRVGPFVRSFDGGLLSHATLRLP